MSTAQLQIAGAERNMDQTELQDRAVEHPNTSVLPATMTELKAPIAELQLLYMSASPPTTFHDWSRLPVELKLEVLAHHLTFNEKIDRQFHPGVLSNQLGHIIGTKNRELVTMALGTYELNYALQVLLYPKRSMARDRQSVGHIITNSDKRTEWGASFQNLQTLKITFVVYRPFSKLNHFSPHSCLTPDRTDEILAWLSKSEIHLKARTVKTHIIVGSNGFTISNCICLKPIEDLITLMATKPK
ncbi:hypothetical protein P153DRAFT_399941 [Dothidotthia symphoricarpi CBS 119687]|uniref:Uncharacterized protein n=1 Tax=Dothidotthia symphoricarpi CBS 119687 TaxID=1392245 RepID=A0A6A6A3S3_9PLEO|nr:uncharacterized protein P153DRAFT_399941 [Dothidotthia symphoricarpi CBS 119687]KAF2125803.1 hypothetical protein P153DRAFT_399941 [Dothidotthia symphoricarpi CBS 119687]